jgi:hypothetical protein
MRGAGTSMIVTDVPEGLSASEVGEEIAEHREHAEGSILSPASIPPATG